MPLPIQFIPVAVETVLKIYLPPFFHILCNISRILSQRIFQCKEIVGFIINFYRGWRGWMDCTELYRGIEAWFDLCICKIAEEERDNNKDDAPG